MNADGSGQTNLTNSTSNDNVPSWSPDGTKILFTSDRNGNQEIYVMNVNGSGQTNLTNHSAYDNSAVWSPNGTKIAFTSNRTGDNEIYLMNPDGTGLINLTNNPSEEGHLSWSPDGGKIVFYTFRGGNWEVYVMNVDGTAQTNLTAYPSAMDIYPEWSPDGAKILFHSNRDGNDEVYVMNANGTGQINLTNNAGVDGWPHWQPLLSTFSGFFQPVDNLPTLNTVNAGSAIPVRFSLVGNQGSNIFVSGYPKSQPIACDSTAPTDGIEETATAGSSSLSYDPITNQYIYAWKTEKVWANTCRQLVVKLKDSTYHRANFKFK
ncbi:MAG: PxKF domain-containing protein [Chloroflexi bacterium]|nr:PxKF domain-containing protein [Chloroflexota bacterium]